MKSGWGGAILPRRRRISALPFSLGPFSLFPFPVSRFAELTASGSASSKVRRCRRRYSAQPSEYHRGAMPAGSGQPGRCATSRTACAANARARMVSAWWGSRTSVDAAMTKNPTASATSRPDPGLCLVRDRQTDVGARRERQQQRRHLGEPQLGNQSIRGAHRHHCGANRLPRQADPQHAKSHDRRAKSFSHSREYSCGRRGIEDSIAGSLPLSSR